MTTSSGLESIVRSLRELVELARLQQQNLAALGERTSEVNAGIDALREVT